MNDKEKITHELDLLEREFIERLNVYTYYREHIDELTFRKDMNDKTLIVYIHGDDFVSIELYERDTRILATYAYATIRAMIMINGMRG